MIGSARAEGRSLAPALKRLALFPDSTRIVNNTLSISGMDLAGLAEQYGTPLYVYDRATMDASVEAYREALREHYSGEAHITYAGKAFLCAAVADWVREEGLWADCTGEGEVAIAVKAHVPREAIIVHGVNKAEGDIQAALEHAGTIVVDNLTELRKLAAMGNPHLPRIWFRLLPGLAVRTHHSHTQTGQHGSKFGMTEREIAEAAKICRQYGLPLEGVHFHQGSNFRDPAPLLEAIRLAVDVAKELDLGNPWHFCPGGGWSVAYHEDELPQPDVHEYVRSISQTVVEKCGGVGLPLPVLHLEPGRSLIARAGVAVYRVGVVKRREDRTWLLVDGGMADNPRHALYGSRYSCLPVRDPNREMNELASVGGPYCESGDVLIEDLQMPHIEEHELIAIPVSGAYQLSMSSNYNGARRPAAVWLEGGRARLIVRREAPADLMQRDNGMGS